MKAFFTVLGFITVGLFIYAVCIGQVKSPFAIYFNSPILNTVTVHGDNPAAPVPMAVTLQLHKDGTVTWKKP
mgnify:CR=1 FL=1